MRVPAAAFQGKGEVVWTQKSPVEPCGREMNKLAFAGPQCEEEGKLLGSGWASHSLQRGYLFPPGPRLPY